MPRPNPGSLANVDSLVGDKVGVIWAADTAVQQLESTSMAGDIAIAPFPKGPAGNPGWIGAPGYGITKNALHPEEAWRFIRDRALYYAGVRDINRLPKYHGLDLYANSFKGTSSYNQVTQLLRDWLGPQGFPGTEHSWVGVGAVSPPVVLALRQYVTGEAGEAEIGEAVRTANRLMAAEYDK